MSNENTSGSEASIGLQPMVLFNTGNSPGYETAVMLGRGVKLTGNDTSGVTVYVGSYREFYDSFTIKVDPKTMAPLSGDLSLMDKVRLRFKAAAERGTDVDFRFCTGDEKSRKPEQDNLRKDYKALKL